MDERLLITMFTETFDDSSRSMFELALSTLLTKNALTWQVLTLELPQACSSEIEKKSVGYSSKESAYVLSFSNNKNEKDFNEMFC